MPLREPFQIGTPTKTMDDTWLQVSDESFLEMERKCNMDETLRATDRPESFEETQLFDIDPPSEFWNQTIPTFDILDRTASQQIAASEEHSLSTDSSTAMHIRRPSTIVEETSSQMSSSTASVASSLSSSVKSRILAEQKSVNDCGSPKSEHNSTNSSSSFRSTTDDLIDTLSIKKRKYKFFADEEITPKVTLSKSVSVRPNMPCITPSTVTKRARPLYLQDSKTNTPDSKQSSNQGTPIMGTPCNTNRQFNDTLEAIDFMIEEGKRQEEAKKNTTIAPTPLFSCKRSRVLNELAAAEMASFSRRGPLIDLMGSPNMDRSPTYKK